MTRITRSYSPVVLKDAVAGFVKNYKTAAWIVLKIKRH
jgi:hypothetical protein